MPGPHAADYKVEIVDASGAPDMQVSVVGDQVVSLVGAANGDVLTVQADGTVAPETPASGAGLTADIDGTLAANSDTRVATQKATKTYADAKVADAIIDGTTTVAPSQNAVFDGLALKAPLAHHTQHEVGGTDYVADPDAITTGEAVMGRRFASSSGIPTGTQSIRLTYFTARKTGTYTQLRMTCGGSGHTLATLVKFAIFSVAGDGTLTCIGVTANDTAMLVTPNTEYTKATTASYAVTAGQRYAFGVLVVTAGTAPTVCGGVIAPGTAAGRAPQLAGIITGQSDMPAVNGTLAASSANGQSPYGELVP